jgi:hypothetical protein
MAGCTSVSFRDQNALTSECASDTEGINADLGDAVTTWSPIPGERLKFVKAVY